MTPFAFPARGTSTPGFYSMEAERSVEITPEIIGLLLDRLAEHQTALTKELVGKNARLLKYRQQLSDRATMVNYWRDQCRELKKETDFQIDELKAIIAGYQELDSILADTNDSL